MPLPHVVLALTVAILWGLNFVVMKHIVSEVPPLAVSGIRFLLAALPLVFFVPRPKVSLKGLLGFGLAFGVVKFSLLFSAFKLGMPAGLASIVLQMQVVFTIVLAYILMAERPQPLQWTGIAIALAGATAIIASQTAAASLAPIIMTVAAALAWSVANILLKQEGRFDALSFAVWSSLFPGVAMLTISLLVEGPSTVASALTGMTWTGIGALAYLVYPVSIVSGAMWAFLLGRHSAAAVAPFALLVPVIGLIAGAIVYGERPTVETLGGGLAIVLGLIVVSASARSVAQAQSAKK